MPVSAFAQRLASIATEQHTRFHHINEADPELCTQIRKWTTAIGFPFASCTTVPWSAVFVSWCVQQAGATNQEFTFAMAHSVYVRQAIRNAVRGEGVFHGVDITAQVPDVGDIIQNNRQGNRFDFEFARTHKNYISHAAIVTEVGQDADGRFAFCVGGNESDSVRQTVVRLDGAGLIRQRQGNPFISVIKTLK